MNNRIFRTRRRILQFGSSVLLAAFFFPSRSGADDPVLIELSGTPNGAHVWFRPRGLLIELGQTVKWVNTDTANVHTSTAYHPANQGKPLRIPAGAKAWDSGYLMPGESYSQTFDTPGVYDYFCLPHEHAGMVGRIIVSAPEQGAQEIRLATDEQLPAAAREQFVPIDRIMEERQVV